MVATRRLFMTVAEGAVFFTVASWAFDLVIALVGSPVFRDDSSSYSRIVIMAMAVLVPDGLAAWWIDESGETAHAMMLVAPLLHLQFLHRWS
jgi:hypothetical protein